MSLYLGVWYQIASIPNVYQKECENSKAEYTLVPEGMKVRNVCMVNGEEVFERTGLAWPSDHSDDGKFKLRFDPSPYQGQKDVGDYWVLWTDYYNYSIVGGPSREYLYILSRNKKVPSSELQKISMFLKKSGYDLSEIVIDPNTLTDA